MFIISEISPQFGNDLDVAEQMILQSKLAGANAAKVQLYPTELFVDHPDPYVKSRELSFEDFKRLKTYGDNIGLPVFATAFTDDRLDWCIELKQKYYKIAARTHAENSELVDRTLSLGETTFVSVPCDYDLDKILIRENCVYLSCVVKYPTLLEEVALPDFQNSIFKGLSDHSPGISAALLAAARGCQYLEKHFTISHSLQRSNEKAHFGAMTQSELAMIRQLSNEMALIKA